MKIPRFIERIFEPRPAPVDETVTYEKPRLRSRHLGSIPYDYWSWSPFGDGYVSCGSGGCHHGGRGIYRDCPVYEPNEAPRVDTVTEHIKAHAYSVPLFGAMGLLGGGALGYGLGLALAHFTGLAPGLTASLSAGLGALGGGIGLAGYAAGDRVRLEWREYSIKEKELVGYTEYVTPHYEQRCRTTTDSEGNSETECEWVQNGWDHTFTPDVRWWSVGSYIGPKVVHYQEQDGVWQPAPDTDPEDPDQPKDVVSREHKAARSLGLNGSALLSSGS